MTLSSFGFFIGFLLFGLVIITIGGTIYSWKKKKLCFRKDNKQYRGGSESEIRSISPSKFSDESGY